MSYFMIGVGGTGAKLVHSLIHLSAAGMLPERGRALQCLLVDADENNGNVDECSKLMESYRACRGLQLGTTDLFNAEIDLVGPWTPVKNENVDSLNEYFRYSQKQHLGALDADLLELLYTETERETKIHQGFRGRPAIGASILAEKISFTDTKDTWYDLIESVRRSAGNGSAPVMIAGSVFGGTGAAGVPTIFRLLEAELKRKVANLRLGLILMLPYFSFETVAGEAVQADPHGFSNATAEALMYYHERKFLNICNSMYALGEEPRAMMRVASVGADTQRNDPHFLEVVAGLGALRFFGDSHGADHSLSIASRECKENSKGEPEDTLTWADLPFPAEQRVAQLRRLKQMILFCVAFRFIYYPWIEPKVNSDQKLGRANENVIREHVSGQGIKSEAILRDLNHVNDYAARFLSWFLSISTSHNKAFQAEFTDLKVFAILDNGLWRLKTVSEFRESEFNKGLFLGGGANPNSRAIMDSAATAKFDGKQPIGTGYLIRALYDSCNHF